MQVDPSMKYFSWDFVNPRKEEKPYKLNDEKHTWVNCKKEGGTYV